MNCPKCMKEIPSDAKWCPECGSKIEKLTSTSVSLGDVGLFKGNIDASVNYHIGQQTNISGDVQVHITEGAKKPDLELFQQRGIINLCAGFYVEAIRDLTEVLREAPQLPDAHYYLAMALLHGKRPRLLTYSQAQEVENHLHNACRSGPAPAHYYYLWAFVKHDFYVLNGLMVREPSIESLLKKATSCTVDDVALEQLFNYMPGEVLDSLLGRG